MSDRGSILISTANDIGEALVEKLGGEGYAPSVWDKEYNKLGIAEVDSAPALSVLEESSETGTARGSILISSANAIGAMLNKKYNTDRGFKPKEWASAASKLAPLPEKSAESSPICAIEDGADDVPTKSLVVTIPPTLDGVSLVTETQINSDNLFLLPSNDFSVSGVDFKIGSDSLTIDGTSTANISSKDSNFKTYFSFGLPKGTYYFTRGTWTKATYVYKLADDSTALVTNSGSFTLTDYTEIYIGFYIGTGKTVSDVTFNGYLKQGSSASSYSPQPHPTQYTASLGRTIYGGEVDIVNGTGTDENGNDFTFDGQEINTRLGYNAFWSDSGDTAVEYYQAPTPYARKTATGGIANFSDQRTDLPLTKAIANIAPSIAGKSAVNLIRAGKNLLPDKTYQRNANTLRLGTDSLDGRLSLKAGTYTLSLTSDVAIGTLTYTIGGTSMGITFSSSGTRYYGSFTLSADTDDIFLHVYKSGGITAEDVSDFMLEVGSSASAYVPYQDPTTYTAELGETVHGGSVDFVSGEVVNDCAKDSMSSSYLSGLSLETYIGYEAQTAYFNYHPSIWVRNWNYQTAAARTAGGIKCACDEFPVSMNNTTIFASQYRIYFDVNGKNISSVQDFIDYVTNLEQNGKQLEITYELATPTESAIPGRVISPIEGVNNYWNDAGGDTEIQYFENEA